MLEGSGLKYAYTGQLLTKDIGTHDVASPIWNVRLISSEKMFNFPL
jgi:hypothetical protein